MQNTAQTNKEKAIVAILTAYSNLNIEQINDLISATNGIKGVSFVSIKGYSSDKSNNTEIANHLINIGASYANMITKDGNIYANFDVTSVNIDKFDYSAIDTAGLTLDEYKAEVKKELPVALDELNQPKAKKDTSADIWLNKALVFNLNTLTLSIFGQSVTKNVETKGTFKLVKSAPKTVAKRLIEKQAQGKAQTLRRFALNNLVGSVTLKGETLEIG